jgi:hypothetical protein
MAEPGEKSQAGPAFTPPRAAGLAAAILLTAAVLLAMGRPLFGPPGFGIWVWDIWSPANSQYLLDPYSFSHLIHGFLFFGLLHLLARGLPLERRLLIAVAIEAAWEVLENSPIIINRYRAATISVGYEGDSVVNSMSDVIMMTLGFLAASRLKLWQSLGVILAMELGCLLLFRDNLTLNVLMLAWPLEAIKQWQLGGRPG